MTDSVREKIINNIVTTLQGITVAGGYQTTVQKVVKQKLVGMQINEWPTIIVIPADETKTQEPIEKYTCKLAMELECWVKEHDTIVTDVNLLLADVEKALMADHTRGGVAVDTLLTGNSAFYNETNKPYGGVIVRIEVHYRHRFSDPLTAG